MNKHLRYALALTILTVAVSGCTPSDSNSDVQAETQTEIQAEDSSQKSEESADITQNEDVLEQSDTELFLNTRPASEQIGSYVADKASVMTAMDQEMAFEQLLLSQEVLSSRLGQLIWNEDYMNALNTTMGGILDAEKVSDIENEIVRQDFQAAVDSYLTIIRYEEYPHFEPDWNRIKSLNLNLSDSMNTVIDINAKVQSGAFVSDYTLNHDLLASDLATLEIMLPKAEGFDHYQMQKLYNNLISFMFVNTEGTELSSFVSGDKRTTDAWNKLAHDYSDYKFGLLAKRIVNHPERDFTKLIDIINGFNMVSPDKNLYADITYVERDNYSINGFALNGHDNPDIQETIRQNVENELMTLHDSQAHVNRMDASVNFINDNYLSVSLFNIAYDKNNDYKSSESYITLDMNTGELVTLDDLFESSFETYQDALNNLDVFTKRQIAAIEMPKYYIHDNGISLIGPVEDEEFPYFITLDLYTLQEFMNISKLY